MGSEAMGKKKDDLFLWDEAFLGRAQAVLQGRHTIFFHDCFHTHSETKRSGFSREKGAMLEWCPSTFSGMLRLTRYSEKHRLTTVVSCTHLFGVHLAGQSSRFELYREGGIGQARWALNLAWL